MVVVTGTVPLQTALTDAHVSVKIQEEGSCKPNAARVQPRECCRCLSSGKMIFSLRQGSAQNSGKVGDARVWGPVALSPLGQ